ncbi:hypothetical protein [Botrimarina mediterranea]|uniref:hypothetical protein n=1 Tax=Botrimarina mediterranea TaxID=2528022 RepID=UPI00118797D6|nr:Endonuclease/Exonuclease/phosphatase family protein [Planctomycetes bacterium K2D]
MSQVIRVAVLCALLAPVVASAQLRVVTYNTLDKPFDSTDLALARTVFEAIATTPRNGIAKRPDVIGLQEQRTIAAGVSTASQLADALNDLFGVSSYQVAISGSGNDLIAAVYDSASVSLEANVNVFTTGPRPTRRLEFQPVGYTSSDATFYNYVSHLKAGSAAADRNLRAEEAERLRNNADALGAGVNIVYSGDFNIYSNNESTYLNLTASGNGEAFDPLELLSWPSAANAQHLTQSTRTTSIGDGGATGGNDDRFDLQLVTSSLLDGEGLSYIGPTSTGMSGLEHSYQAFGNDGVSYNQRINNTFVGRSQPAAVLNALHDFSDHLPVIADYQLPAVLGYALDEIPLTLEQGEEFALGLTVTNDADVVAAVGADELDFSISTSGSITGAFAGVAAALSAGLSYDLSLDTSTLGLRSGMLTISSLSQAAENSLVQVPISFEVIAAALAGDYNNDGRVDAADYTVWRDGNSPDDTQAGYDVWAANYGASIPQSTSVPEPTSVLMMLALLVGSAGRTARVA